jgi:aspartyl-tRNA(Asn)/glutamyl-tRNA(Gln) amidotransferase subunit A
LVKDYLQRIHQHEKLNAFLEVFEQDALERADAVDKKIAENTQGRLAGMVLGLKDVLCFKDHKVEAGSRILNDFTSLFSATAVERVLAEDAIIIGRLNCDEFAMGSSNENSAFGPVINGIGENRVPGGSSGGAAVAVQMDLCLVTLGSDTGGSVRQPAAFCGVVGIKPTYSRVSRYGLIAYASSFDVIGVFSKTVEDNALVLEIMAGADDLDSTCSRQPVPQYSKKLDFNRKCRIAYVKDTLDSEGIAPEVKFNTLEKIRFLKEQGHQVEAVDFPIFKYALPTYYILITAEASSNLARFDGVKYGYRSPNTSSLESMYKKSRTEGFGEEVKRRILLGTFVLSASYYDAYYTKAQKVRRVIQNKMRSLLSDYDFILMPTTPTTAFRLGERNHNPLEMYLADLYTVQASVAGIPSINIPNGYDDDGMPVGLQVMANFFEEDKLYAFSNYLMKQNQTLPA